MENNLPPLRNIQQINLGLPIEQRVNNLEIQSDVHSSRLESEMGTRSRAHGILHERLDKQDAVLSNQDVRLIRIERLIWACAGAAFIMEFLPKLKLFLTSHP